MGCGWFVVAFILMKLYEGSHIHDDVPRPEFKGPAVTARSASPFHFRRHPFSGGLAVSAKSGTDERNVSPCNSPRLR